MLQSILQQKGRGLRVGACSLVLGISSLFLATGSALAIPTSVTLTDTLMAGDLTCDTVSTKCPMGTSGDFKVVNQKPLTQSLGDGINERYVGEFDLATNPADYALFLGWNIQSAVMEVVIDGVNGSANDGFWLGATTNLNNGYIDVDNILAPNEVPYALTGGQIGAGQITVNFNLLNYYTKSQILSFITGGNDGNVWLRLGDDHFVYESTLTVTAAQTPEPASFLMLGTGLVGMAAWRYRKTRQHQ